MFSRVVVVGVCVGQDRFTPAMAINKEIDLRFVIGYTPLEFRDTLHMLADGKVDPRPLITGDGRARRRRGRVRTRSGTPRPTRRSSSTPGPEGRPRGLAHPQGPFCAPSCAPTISGTAQPPEETTMFKPRTALASLGRHRRTRSHRRRRRRRPGRAHRSRRAGHAAHAETRPGRGRRGVADRRRAGRGGLPGLPDPVFASSSTSRGPQSRRRRQRPAAIRGPRQPRGHGEATPLAACAPPP